MGKTGCTLEGELDTSRFSDPIPWIGLYAAAASAVCVIAMALDAFHAFRFRKFWFPCNFFSINATTLTVLAVATKLSVDLVTPMPRHQDQLAKLSSAVFFCTVMANFMPSLGAMEDNNEILMNLVALGILVVTVIVNICIQLHTGGIYVFLKEYVFVMVLMLVLFILIVSSSLTIPATKSYFDMKYKKKHKAAKEQCNYNYQMGRCISQNVCNKLKEDLNKYWMMAHTCNPQFVMGRLATCTASGAICLLSTAALAVAMLRSYLMPQRFEFCAGESDYEWSTFLILVVQTIGVGIGSLGPASRWFIAINFTCHKKARKAFKVDYATEDYWIYKLNQWRDNPLFFRIYGRQSRNLAESTKMKVFDWCIHFQRGVVFMSKIIRFVSVYSVVQFLTRFLKMVKWSLRCKASATTSESPSQKMQALSQYVLHLEGEKELIDMIMERNCDPIKHWIKISAKNQPTNLINLLEKLKPGQEFLGVKAFDNSNLVSSLDSTDPPNIWALPVVTLTSIAVAIPNINRDSVTQLIHSVHESLIYIRFIEENLDVKNEYLNIRKAAAIVWVGVDLQHKWLDVDLRKMSTSTNNTSPKQVLEELSILAKERFLQSRDKDPNFSLWESPAHWPVTTLAANSMYRITQTFLLAGSELMIDDAERMFDKLSAMITDIVGACLTNLQHVISEQCHHGSIEQREEKIRRAILLLGRTHKILDILEKQKIPSTVPEHRWFIDTWRMTMSSNENSLQPPSTTTPSDDANAASSSTSSSPDVYLTVD